MTKEMLSNCSFVSIFDEYVLETEREQACVITCGCQPCEHGIKTARADNRPIKNQLLQRFSNRTERRVVDFPDTTSGEIERRQAGTRQCCEELGRHVGDSDVAQY